jgi:transposase
MLTVDHYDLIKQKLRDGMSQREVAKKLGHSRNTVAKAVQSRSAQSGCLRTIRSRR